MDDYLYDIVDPIVEVEVEERDVDDALLSFRFPLPPSFTDIVSYRVSVLLSLFSFLS